MVGGGHWENRTCASPGFRFLGKTCPFRLPMGAGVSVDELVPIIINAAAMGAGGLGLAAVALLARPLSLPVFSRALMALLGILILDAASSIFDLSPWAEVAPQWSGASYVLWPWIPVLLWAYVAGLTARAPLRAADFRGHAIAACLGMLLYLPTLLLPGADKLALANGTLRPASSHHVVMALGLLGFVLLWIAQMLVSLHLIAKQLIAHRRRMRDLLSDVAAVDLRWIDGFGLFIGVGILLAVADNVGGIFLAGELLDSTTGAVFEAAIIVGLALFGLTQKAAVPDWAIEIERAPDAPVADPEQSVPSVPMPAETIPLDAETPPANGEARYARSSLTLDDCQAIVARLDKLMASAEPWRDPFLNLKMLSEGIATKPYYVTQALNTVLERNFYDYVNGWRARAAAAALKGSDASILSICEDVGFNSKSTFNTAFRKEMGETPTGYRRAGGPDTRP